MVIWTGLPLLLQLDRVGVGEGVVWGLRGGWEGLGGDGGRGGRRHAHVVRLMQWLLLVLADTLLPDAGEPLCLPLSVGDVWMCVC